MKWLISPKVRPSRLMEQDQFEKVLRNFRLRNIWDKKFILSLNFNLNEKFLCKIIASKFIQYISES
jgi:hypothetical protein